MKPLSAFLALFLLVASGRAAAPAETSAGDAAHVAARAPITHDLGRNLVYHRIHELPADLPAVDAPRRQPRIVDLRYVGADDAGAAALQSWVKANATPRTPVFLLANPSTDRDLVAPFTGRRATASVLVVGPRGRGFAPDIEVNISADDERRAYDALEAGADLATLLTDNPDKVRNDEASLSRDRSTDSAPAESAAGATNPASAIPVDATLQRAVHLHRSLVALRRI